MAYQIQRIPDGLPAAKAPLRILVVDDNVAVVQTLGQMIEAMGHKARIATDGVRALTEAKEFLPHVVLLDIGMGNMNGYEVCQVMKQAPEMKRTMFIAQTGWDKDENEGMSREAGFDHYLTKPVRMKELETLFAEAIRAEFEP